MSLGDEKYLALTTYKRDGTPVTTAAWAAPIDDNKIGFWTSSASGKAKRLAHTSKVTIQPCDARGRVKPGTSPVDATAVLDLIEREQISESYGTERLLQLRERKLRRELATPSLDMGHAKELQEHLAKVRQALAELT